MNILHIGIAMFGYNFCRSAQKCLALKMENAGRAITLMMICRGVLFLGKIVSVFASMFLCKYLQPTLTSLNSPKFQHFPP